MYMRMNFGKTKTYHKVAKIVNIQHEISLDVDGLNAWKCDKSVIPWCRASFQVFRYSKVIKYNNDLWKQWLIDWVGV